jgi:transcriptional regulator with XRE-family HTH domain
MERRRDTVLAATIRVRRRRRGLSQDELAEIARVSTKTIRRLEGGQSVGLGSRQAVLAALEIDPQEIELENETGERIEATAWRAIASAQELLAALVAARRVDVELDRDGWRRARRERPWYRQNLVFATHDPARIILAFVDRAREIAALSAGERARESDRLAEAMRAAGAMAWAVAARFDAAGCLHLYLGAPSGVARRIAAGR